ncbi:Signal peptidase I [Prochlorococcus marinus str. MIT 9211]|uniref:Signal peptidase I n=2 Tax=Prochlorococcus marinus TaxID=1219 RepID=A9BED6_PROM4|nr:Signal peptidase I [Prochlorococcus marinus str. MIT 9211]
MLKKKASNPQQISHVLNQAMAQRFFAFWDFWGPVIITFTLYLGIRNYLAEARYIPSGSMLPTLEINDRLVIEKLTFRRRPPKRGEIVVFNSPFSFDQKLISERSTQLPSTLKCTLLSLPLINLIPGLGDPACDAYIKRVVAVAGDEVFVGFQGELFVNSQLVNEPYVERFCTLSANNLGNCKSLRAKVPEGHVFVLGDNRRNSWDGRFWPGSQFLPHKEIIGRATWRFWPINRIGGLR